ncbi:MAG: hypothetical protein ABIN89_22830 [Chitinophagaceae bacterium]
MRHFVYIIFILCFTSCENSEKARMLEQKEMMLIKKEQDILLKEQSLALRESALALKEKKVDSASLKLMNDSLAATRPVIKGMWLVKMNCTETTCSTSAVGDTKTEQWDISQENSLIIAKSTSSDKTGRIYSGKYVGEIIELAALQDSTAAGRSTKMIVRLQPTKEDEMEGQRQIIREDDCQVIYAMQLKKQL